MAETTKKPTAAKKTTAPKAAAKPAAKKPAVKKPAAEKPEKVTATPVAEATVAVDETGTVETPTTFNKPTLAKGRYVYATGRRKTAVANVRLFAGSEDSTVNKKSLDAYFHTTNMRDTAVRPLALTGLLGDFYFYASVNGGGSNAQTEAIRHGIAQALAIMSEDMRTVLKKNGFLTRDDRKKERKKPGLRGARRAPQWAKR
jgi:small subunit ribosomal protein S9